MSDDAPLPPRSGTGPWTWTVPDVPRQNLPKLLHVVQRALPVDAVIDVTAADGSAAALDHSLWIGAGFAIDDGRIPTGTPDGPPAIRVVRLRTLADSVGPDMGLLICGVNPSPYSADAGIGYARPGNRFWPAALAAGIVPADRDPVAALAAGVGMTDFAKRPTRTAAEVTSEEYESGFGRVSALAEWLGPGAVCFVGLSGWRAVVDRHAVAGVQPVAIGGRPAYVMPSTSGLNARTSLAELADHLRTAWDLGRMDVHSRRPVT